jgi:REP element-mobilizing transposase RayT
MPRLKPDQPLTYYHVMTRTAQKSFLLSEDHDPEIKVVVDQIIKSMAEIFYVEIFAYAYLSNHYHLAISIAKPEMDPSDLQQRFEKLQQHNAYPTKWQPEQAQKVYDRFTDLSRFMGEINRRIAVAHNRRHKTAGHFWGGRFKSQIIEDEDALLRVATYIEQNPVRARLSDYPSEYRWCSAGEAKEALERGATANVPAIPPFHRQSGNTRAMQYIQWMDYQAELIIRPESANRPPPPEIRKILLTENQMTKWYQDFNDRKPVDWGSQAYGSQKFEQTIAKAVRAKRQAMTLANPSARVGPGSDVLQI